MALAAHNDQPHVAITSPLRLSLGGTQHDGGEQFDQQGVAKIVDPEVALMAFLRDTTSHSNDTRVEDQDI